MIVAKIQRSCVFSATDFRPQLGHVSLLRLQLGKVRLGSEIADLAQALGEGLGGIGGLSLRKSRRLQLAGDSARRR